MRNGLMDFTRGTQVAETIAMMFSTALKPMLLTATAIVATLVGWQLWHHSQRGDTVLWLMHMYAWTWLWFGFSPGSHLGIRGAGGERSVMAIADVIGYPPVAAAWDRLTAALRSGLSWGLIVGIPLAIASTAALRRYGRRLVKRTHKRGAQLATPAQLTAEVEAFNLKAGAEDRAADLRRILGPGAWHKQHFNTRRELIRAGLYEPFTIAGIPYPWHSEQSHTMLVGTTGTGKSTAMKDLLAQIRERGQRAVVFDLTGTFVESFYDPDSDIILNPFDARCPKWTPFSDASTREHFKEASLALVPMGDGGGEQFWPESARMLFVEVCVRLVQQGRGTNEALSDVLMTSTLRDLHAHVLKTVAAPLTDPEARRMAESIRATFNTYAQALMTLPTEGPPFSIRDWVQSIDANADSGNPTAASVLFVAAQHVNLRSVRVLLTMWLSTAINTLMSMTGDQRQIRLWFLLDEIGALHNIPAIVMGMQTARNFGGAFVLGVHTMAQLKQTYGDNYAETIASLAKTKLLMNTRDRATQEWEQAQAGDGEWAEMEENWSYGANNVRDAATLQHKVKLEPLVIASEFGELPDLQGYLKFPQGLPAALVTLRYVRYPKTQKGFIERPIAALAPSADTGRFTVDGDYINADGEVLTPPGDPSGEGYQQTVAKPPERLPASPDLVDRMERAESENPAASVNIALDPRFTVASNAATLGGTAALTAVVASPVKEAAARDPGRPTAAAAPHELDTGRTGLALLEQRLFSGELGERHHQHGHDRGDAGVDDELGMP